MERFFSNRPACIRFQSWKLFEGEKAGEIPSTACCPPALLQSWCRTWRHSAAVTRCWRWRHRELRQNINLKVSEKPFLAEILLARRWWKLPRRRQTWRQPWSCAPDRTSQRAPAGRPPGTRGCPRSPAAHTVSLQHTQWACRAADLSPDVCRGAWTVWTSWSPPGRPPAHSRTWRRDRTEWGPSNYNQRYSYFLLPPLSLWPDWQKYWGPNLVFKYRPSCLSNYLFNIYEICLKFYFIFQLIFIDLNNWKLSKK